MASVYDAIISNIKSVFSASDLNPSKVAIFEKIANSIAPTIDNTLAEITNTQAIIENIIGLKQYGRAGDYIARALEFEYSLVNNIGVKLSVDPVTLKNVYSNPNTNLQIIKVAVFDESKMVLKVAYYDPNSNSFKALPTSYTANSITVNLKALFDTYFQSVAEIPGLPVIKISNDANKLSLNASITYYGTYDLITIKTMVPAAMIAFRDSNSTNNGVLYTNDLANYVKNNVPGVRNMAISGTSIDLVSFDGFTELLSGYFDYANTNIITYVAS